MGDTPTKPSPVSRISQEKLKAVLERAKKSIARSHECIRQTKALQESSEEMIAESQRRKPR
jgi:hypothetical protein